MIRPIAEMVEINDQALKANKVAQDGLRREAITASAEDEERIVAKIARARVQFTKLALIGVRLRAATVQILDIPDAQSDRLDELADAIDDQIIMNASINFTIDLATNLLNKSGEVLGILNLVTPVEA